MSLCRGCMDKAASASAGSGASLLPPDIAARRLEAEEMEAVDFSSMAFSSHVSLRRKFLAGQSAPANPVANLGERLSTGRGGPAAGRRRSRFRASGRDSP